MCDWLKLKAKYPADDENIALLTRNQCKCEPNGGSHQYHHGQLITHFISQRCFDDEARS